MTGRMVAMVDARHRGFSVILSVFRRYVRRYIRFPRAPPPPALEPVVSTA